MDPYRILGVPPNATREEIKSAYRRAAKLSHPDLTSAIADPASRLAAEERFKSITNAYRTLVDRHRASSGAGTSTTANNGYPYSQYPNGGAGGFAYGGNFRANARTPRNEFGAPELSFHQSWRALRSIERYSIGAMGMMCGAFIAWTFVSSAQRVETMYRESAGLRPSAPIRSDDRRKREEGGDEFATQPT